MNIVAILECMLGNDREAEQALFMMHAEATNMPPLTCSIGPRWEMQANTNLGK